jgi:hypothetical protein
MARTAVKALLVVGLVGASVTAGAVAAGAGGGILTVTVLVLDRTKIVGSTSDDGDC